MATATKRLKDMTEDERKAYYRDATRRWRQRNPEQAAVVRDRRFARIAAETPEETATRRAKERAYEDATRERRNFLRRERNKRDPSKSRASRARYIARYPERVKEIAIASKKKHHVKYKPRLTAARNRRRARVKGATKTEPIRLDVLAERDHWTCHICTGEVTRTNWSMDHLLPLSKGGDHTYANVALAHRLCNVRRGIQPVAEVRALHQS